MDFVKDMLKIMAAVAVGISLFYILLPKNNKDIILTEGNDYAHAMREYKMVDFSILCFDGKVFMKGIMSNGEETIPVNKDDGTIRCEEDTPYIMTINIPK